MNNTNSINIGVFKVIGPARIIRKLTQYEKVYESLYKTLGLRHSIIFVNKENDLPNTDTVFRYQESDMVMNIARINNQFYVYARKYSYEWIIDKLIFLGLLELGLARIHAGAIQFTTEHDYTIIFAGRGGVGKTTLILNIITTNPYNFSFLGDDIIAVDKDGVVYPLPRKINLYKYHLSLLKNSKIYRIVKSRALLKELKAFIGNKLIDVTRRIIGVLYELPYFQEGHIGEFDIYELFDVSIGSPGHIKKIFYLTKSYRQNEPEITSISLNKALNLIVNETLAEELWGHVNKFMEMVSTLFAFNPSVKMYEILKRALQNVECYYVKVPPLHSCKSDRNIRLILKYMHDVK